MTEQEFNGTNDPRRTIPPVNRLLNQPPFVRLLSLYGRGPVRVQVRKALNELRRTAGANDVTGVEVAESLRALPDAIEAALRSQHGGRLTRVINATGIFIHTNLGRSPLPRELVDDLPRLLDAYCDLEMDLDSGKRSDRNRRVASLLVELTGSEAATVVNNNAGALVLVLMALASAKGRREVIVSRGELVEIGGSFRIPDMLSAAGAELVEVGTTNRTRLSDYADAIGPRTALVLKVFPSNYRVIGFTSEVRSSELAQLAHDRGIPMVVDEGSGLLQRHPAPQLADHPSVSELIAAGCDLVASSGDKLLGGPQAGLIVGRRWLVDKCRRHPFYRAFRPDRASYAVLEGVLHRHLAGGVMPVDRLWLDPETSRSHNRRLDAVIEGIEGSQRIAAQAFLGGGSAPERPIPGEGIAIEGSDELLHRLRMGDPAVVGYLRDGHLILDLRTVDPSDDDALVEAVLNARAAIANSAENLKNPKRELQRE